jgi:hypothetical protein
MNQWVTASASVRGAGHVKTNTPCQDYSIVRTSADSKWVSIVVSDGAGTANRSDEGARHVTQYFGSELMKLATELNTRSPGNWVNDFVIEKVLETRKALRLIAQSDNIRDFNCTLVACLIGPQGGFSIHIGDGVIIGGFRDHTNGVDSGRLFASKPENGEYANETFFITEKDWIRHLRIQPIPSLDWIVCCSDGGSALALVSDETPKMGFLQPVIDTIVAISDVRLRNSRLIDFLSDSQADKVTGDDKTLVIAILPNRLEKLQWYTAPQSADRTEVAETAAKIEATSKSTEKTIFNNGDLQKIDNTSTVAKIYKRKYVKFLSVAFFLIIVISTLLSLSAEDTKYFLLKIFSLEEIRSQNGTIKNSVIIRTEKPAVRSSDTAGDIPPKIPSSGSESQDSSSSKH